MEMKDLFEIWNHFEHSSAEEMELDMQGVHFSLKRNTNTEAKAILVDQMPLAPVGKTEQKVIAAPLVGTFYHAASPEAEPFVKVGDLVKKGDVIGIIEAMKLMNEIKAEEDGVVEEILVEDASMVEFGQGLVRLE